MNINFCNISSFNFLYIYLISTILHLPIEAIKYLSKNLEINTNELYSKIVSYNSIDVSVEDDMVPFVCSTAPRLICDKSYWKLWLYKKIEILNLLKKYNNNLTTSKLTDNDYIIKDKYCRNVLESPLLMEDDLLDHTLNCVWIGNGEYPKCLPMLENTTGKSQKDAITVYEPDIWKKKYINFLKVFECDMKKYNFYVDDIQEVYICKEYCVASGFGPFYQLVLLFTIILNVIDYNFLS
uniref:Myristylated protein n=1 Tax=Strongyloides venezuelensis TaxID=75913 RepID=A0A0K0FLH1_STRVS